MRHLPSCLCCLLIAGSVALGQDPMPKRYFPLNTPLPPTGRAGDWATQIKRGNPFHFQPVEIQLPVTGQVTWYGSNGPESPLISSAPSIAGLLVGPVYRLRLSDMANYPGVELYPSIEMIDRLHPPTGREAEFPVIIPFTEFELDAAAQGQLVTKVVYLEQPNRAAFQTAGRGKAVEPLRVTSRENPLEIADLQGRPLAIVRMGGRVPDRDRPEPGFFGRGAPIQTIQTAAAAPGAAKIEPPDRSVIVRKVPDGRPKAAIAVEDPQPTETTEAAEETPQTETPSESDFEE